MHHHPSADSSTAIEHVASCALPTPWATFELHAFTEKATGKEHLAIVLGSIGNGQPVLARLHSECLTGDTLFSLRCDCGTQLESALRQIAKEKRGILLYLRQEGRAARDRFRPAGGLHVPGDREALRHLSNGERRSEEHTSELQSH